MKVIIREEQFNRVILKEEWYDEEDTYYSGDYPDKGDEGLGEKIMLVRELQDEIDELMSVIPYTETKDEAYDIQEDILELEDRLHHLQWEIENNLRESDIKCITKRVLSEQISIGNPRKKFYNQPESVIDKEFCKDIPDSILVKVPDQGDDIEDDLNYEGRKRMIAKLYNVPYNDFNFNTGNKRDGKHKIIVTLSNGKQFDASDALAYCLKAYDIDNNKPVYRGCIGDCTKGNSVPAMGIPSEREY